MKLLKRMATAYMPLELGIDHRVRPARRGWPAPTVLVDGKDLSGMSEPQGVAMACRTYEGGTPSEAQIVDAMGTFTAR